MNIWNSLNIRRKLLLAVAGLSLLQALAAGFAAASLRAALGLGRRLRSSLPIWCLIVAAPLYMGFRATGQWGGEGLVALSSSVVGSERADSLALDFHKWGQVPYDAGFVLVRDGDLHRRTFASPAAYLRRDGWQNIDRGRQCLDLAAAMI